MKIKFSKRKQQLTIKLSVHDAEARTYITNGEIQLQISVCDDMAENWDPDAVYKLNGIRRDREAGR